MGIRNKWNVTGISSWTITVLIYYIPVNDVIVDVRRNPSEFADDTEIGRMIAVHSYIARGSLKWFVK